MNLNYDIQNIEKVLADALINGGVPEKVYKGQRPSKADTMTAFYVVSVPTSITDLSAYGRCISRIEMFVKNDANGLKNSTKFSLMYSKICSLFPIQNDKYLFDIYPTIVPLGNDNEGFHIQAININTTIKTI